jgi:hypothetical protein
MNPKTSLTIDASLASSVKKNKSKKRSSEPGRDTASTSNPEPVVDHGQEESGPSQPEGTASAEQLVEPTVAEVVDVEPAAVDAREAPHVSHFSGFSGVVPRHEHPRSESETRTEERLDHHRDIDSRDRDSRGEERRSREVGRRHVD